MKTEYITARVEWIETPQHEEYEIDGYMSINEQNIIAIQNGKKGLPDIFWMSDGSQYAISEYYQTGKTIIGVKKEKLEGLRK